MENMFKNCKSIITEKQLKCFDDNLLTWKTIDETTKALFDGAKEEAKSYAKRFLYPLNDKCQVEIQNKIEENLIGLENTVDPCQ